MTCNISWAAIVVSIRLNHLLLFQVVKNRQGRVNDKIDKIDKLISLHTQYNQHNPINLLYSTPATTKWLGTNSNALREALLSLLQRFGGIHLNATNLLYTCIQPHNTKHSLLHLSPPIQSRLVFAHHFFLKPTSSTTARQLSLSGSVWNLGSGQAIIPPIDLAKSSINCRVKVF